VKGKLRDDEVPVPELKPGKVLVRVHAVGLNRARQHPAHAAAVPGRTH